MLDEKTKTAALIASIRDQCYNSSMRGSTPDDDLDEYGNKKYGDLKPLSDSDDGDDDDVDDSFFAFARGRKAATSYVFHFYSTVFF